jgi:predicted nuclease of restriction endonuclease-like (RecB) superfamily
LEASIKSQLYHRQGKAITNFAERLPAPHADMAAQILKDPYHFDFLGLGDEAHERDIENALIRHITRFLMELGQDSLSLDGNSGWRLAGTSFSLTCSFTTSA